MHSVTHMFLDKMLVYYEEKHYLFVAKKVKLYILKIYTKKLYEVNLNKQRDNLNMFVISDLLTIHIP